ncbi:hypothetical protein SG34_017490 [Thalassomonas viridans]|uniref:Uncharacterized protein n=1 Tax=Thalassomonas viridans TaxID=137584 RepID=A0AAE9YZB2_9GAMM|nr:hypothetical protein [Thalassomonas viridans]WDE03200.1 hypothetical protein SG34_017490 [Thalassomonas viridans]
MALTSKQQEQAMAHLDQHFRDNRLCYVCGKNQWIIHPQLYELMKLPLGGADPERSLIPLLVIECADCGHTISFNAKKAGLLSKSGIGG